MPLDTLYRHQQALDPSALTIIAGAVHGVAAAVADCHAAALDPETDAAVILLARHLGRMAEAMAGSDDALRRACAERIAVMRGQPFGRGRARLETPVGHHRSRIAA